MKGDQFANKSRLLKKNYEKTKRALYEVEGMKKEGGKKRNE